MKPDCPYNEAWQSNTGLWSLRRHKKDYLHGISFFSETVQTLHIDTGLRTISSFEELWLKKYKSSNPQWYL